MSDTYMVLNKLLNLNCNIFIRTLHQYSPAGLSVMMKMFYVYANAVATIDMWLLSTQNVARETVELNINCTSFQLI